MASGKSLVAKYLVDTYGFKELAFAARLKEIAADIFAMDVAKKDEKGRSLLQQLAQHMREIDPMVWVRYVLRQVPEEGNVVISDVRFPNEYQTLKRLGFTMVRMAIDRPTQERVVAEHYPGLPLVLMEDYSETALDNFDFDAYINNNGGVPLKRVYQQVEHLIDQLKGGK